MRAGIRAAIEAIRDAISHQRQFLLWIISMYTCVKRYASKRSVGPGVEHNDHDICKGHLVPPRSPGIALAA